MMMSWKKGVLQNKKSGFVIMVVVSLTMLVMLTAWVIINIGLGEIIQSRISNDLKSAFYVASAGAEYMYAVLKSSSTVLWGQLITGNLIISGATIGSYSVTANTISSDEFCIVATGTVAGRSQVAVVKYGFSSNFTGGVPLASIGDMLLKGATNPAKLKIEGPVMSNGTITLDGRVDLANPALSNQNLRIPDFWETPDPANPTNLRNIPLDTNDDGFYNDDLNGDGVVTREEALAEANVAKLAAVGKDSLQVFTDDNAYNSDTQINGKDAFYYYYTIYLNNPANNKLHQNLQIGEGGAYHYNSNQAFNKYSIPDSVPIVFIDGNVTIDKNDQNWQGSGVLNHTIVVMGNVSLTQPTNRPGDVLTIVAYGNIYMTGEMGNQGGTIGDLIIYTNGNLVAENGGKINGSILAKGTLTIDTIGDDQGKDHRMLNASTIDWSDPNARPLGLPPGYGIISSHFIIDNESTYKSIWQKK